jgi:hypothetical protein
MHHYYDSKSMQFRIVIGILRKLMRTVREIDHLEVVGQRS